MTDREAFYTVWEHLQNQEGRSYSDRGGCLYRDDHGRKCAVGILIPDSEYNPEFEGMPTDVVLRTCPSLQNLDRDLLIALQAVHDRAEHWDDLEFNTRGVGVMNVIEKTYEFIASFDPDFSVEEQ